MLYMRYCHQDGITDFMSIAIQLDLIKYKGGIILIDEIEQGLEPDRVKFLVNHRSIIYIKLA